MAKIYKMNNGVVLEDNEGHSFNFPLNSLILTADETSDMVNFKLKAYKRTITSINYKTFTTPKASNAESLLKIIQNIIYY